MLHSRFTIFVIIALAIILGTVCVIMFSLIAGNQPETATPVASQPTLHPTFTPTPVQPTPTPLPPTPLPPPAEPTHTPVSAPVEEPTQTPVSQPVEEATPSEPPTATVEPPTPTPDVVRVEVTSATVNLRSGPDTNYKRVGQAARGQVFDVAGRDESGGWFQIKRSDGNAAWIINDKRWTQPIGDTMSVAVVQNIPAPPPTAKPAPTKPPVPTNTPAPSFAFDLVAQNQFPQPNVVTVHLYVFSSTEPALGGYSLSVKHNGVALPVNGVSQGGQPSQTWPTQSPRTRFTNMKVEFPGSPGGEWVVQLVDSGGTPQGPAATFHLTNDEQDREMYVRYKRK